MSIGRSNTKATTPQFSLLQGILPFDRSRLIPEIGAGLTLAALGIPEVMGYTRIIGTPVITGLYTLLLPVVVFAIFGSSRHLMVAADSATAAMVSAALASYVGGPKYVALTGLVALVAGGLLLLARVLRLGFLADFLSRTALVGFLTGVGARSHSPSCMTCWDWKTAARASSAVSSSRRSISTILIPAAFPWHLHPRSARRFRTFRTPLAGRPVGRGRSDRCQRPVPLGQSRHQAGR